MNTQTKLMQWQVDRSSAEAYERYLVPLLFAPGADVLNNLAGVKHGDNVLDVACGTGIVARRAAQEVGAEGSVTGLDLNENMLEVARAASADSHPAIEWTRGDATSLSFPDEGFDAVLCQQGLQFFPEASAALSEMHRVLTPAGRLAISVLRSLEYNPGYIHLANVLERHVGSEAGAMMRSPFSSMTSEDLRNLISSAGFRQVKVIHGIAPVRYLSVDEFLQQEIASSPISGHIASMTNGVEEAMIRDLSDLLHDRVDDDGIVFPAETYLAVARR